MQRVYESSAERVRRRGSHALLGIRPMKANVLCIIVLSGVLLLLTLHINVRRADSAEPGDALAARLINIMPLL